MTTEQIISILFSALSRKSLNVEQRSAFLGGLDVLEKAGKASAFVKDSRKFRDYARRTRQLLSLLQTIDLTPVQVTKQIERNQGRPTKEKQKAYNEAQRKIAIQEAKSSLFPEIEPDITMQPLTFKGIVANPNGESIAASMPHLDQLRPFLSAHLQERVNTVRELRNEMAAKAEQAKVMSEANERYGGSLYKEEEIAKLASRAVLIESDILPSIYIAIDREIGECYLRLNPRTGDPEYIAEINEKFNMPAHDIRSRFKPFYEKSQSRDPHFAQMVADKIANDRPEVKAARDEAMKHKSEADALIKYIIRKDKKPTTKRIDGLRARITQLRDEYSDIISEKDLEGYQAILLKTIDDSKKQNKK